MADKNREKILSKFGSHFERDLNPEKYDEMYGEYVAQLELEAALADAEKRRAMAGVLPTPWVHLDSPTAASDMTAVVVHEPQPKEEPVEDTRVPVIELPGGPYEDPSEEELAAIRSARDAEFDPRANERKLVDGIETALMLAAPVVGGAGATAAMNQARGGSLMKKGATHIADYLSGNYHKLPQYLLQKGSTKHVPYGLRESAARAMKAGYKIPPEGTVGVWEKPLKDGTARISAFGPSGDWINVPKPGAFK